MFYRQRHGIIQARSLLLHYSCIRWVAAFIPYLWCSVRSITWDVTVVDTLRNVFRQQSAIFSANAAETAATKQRNTACPARPTTSFQWSPECQCSEVPGANREALADATTDSWETAVLFQTFNACMSPSNDLTRPAFHWQTCSQFPSPRQTRFLVLYFRPKKLNTLAFKI